MMHLCNLIARKSQTQHTEAKIGEDPDLRGIHTREPWSAAKLREQSCSDCNGQMCCLPSKVMPWCRDPNQAITQKQHFRALTRRHGTVAPFLLSPGTSQYPPPDESLASRRRPWLLSSSKLGKPSTDLANLVTRDILIPNCSKRTSKKHKNSLLFVCWNVKTSSSRKHSRIAPSSCGFMYFGPVFSLSRNRCPSCKQTLHCILVSIFHSNAQDGLHLLSKLKWWLDISKNQEGLFFHGSLDLRCMPVPHRLRAEQKLNIQKHLQSKHEVY